jgi:hypothetical protein
MSTVDRARMPSSPLVPGQRLDQRTFHELYEATTPETRAELIGGIVYLTPPHRAVHGQILMALTCCLATYHWKTKGVEGAGRVTIKMDDLCEVEPDCGLRIPRELGGRSWVDEDGYVSGIPELLIEIDDYSREIDLGPRKADYERVRVREYVFVGLHPQELRCLSSATVNSWNCPVMKTACSGRASSQVCGLTSPPYIQMT